MSPKFLSQARYQLFEALDRLLPASAKRVLSAWPLLQPVRDRFFRSSGSSRIATGHVNFQGLTFSFSAPYQTLAKARRRGIESTLCRVIMEYVASGGCCIDVGANYGFLTMVMASTVGQHGQVFAFEAEPSIFAVTRQNITRNGFDTICKPYNLFVAEYVEHQTDGGSVKRSSLDELLANSLNRLDLIKIDVDGNDLAVLAGAAQIIGAFRPLLIVEAEHEKAQVYQWLCDAGYPYILDMKGVPVDPGKWPPNIIASYRPLSQSK